MNSDERKKTRERWEFLTTSSRTKTMKWIKAKEQFKKKASIELAKKIESLEKDLAEMKIEMQELAHQLTKK